MLQRSPDLTTTSWATLIKVPPLNPTNPQEKVLLAVPDPSGFFVWRRHSCWIPPNLLLDSGAFFLHSIRPVNLWM